MKNLLNLDILTQTMDNLPIGVGIFHVLDLKDIKSIQYVFMNKILLHEMRKQKEEVFGKLIIEVAPEAYEHEGGRLVMETYRKIAEEGGSINLGMVEYSNHMVAGTYECSVHHIQDNYIYVMLRNVTELEASRKELAEVNKTLEQKVLDRTQQLEESRRKLADINIELEKRVLERTAQLKHKNKELEQFAYVASHDLQEPLRTLTSFVELLQEEVKGKVNDTANDYLNFISGASDRMRKLVKDILDYSHIGQGTKLTSINCNKLLQDIQVDLAATIAKTSTTFNIEELPVINGYETELRLLFQNLISNAIKFRKPDSSPEISISAKKDKGWTFAIKDNGIGIEDQYKEKIFTIFQRLHTKTEYEGTGIGLAHCQKIVDLHHGEIWVESQPNEGSTFYFNINA